jgi:hypothetical protein
MRTIKIYCEPNVAIRLPVDCSFATVQQSLGRGAILRYTDEEGDSILVRNDAELQGARLYQAGRPSVVLHLYSANKPHPAASVIFPAVSVISSSGVAVPAAPPAPCVGLRVRHCVAGVPPPLQAMQRHEMLGMLLDLGFCDMQRNLMMAKRAHYQLQPTIELLLEGQASAREAVEQHLKNAKGK